MSLDGAFGDFEHRGDLRDLEAAFDNAFNFHGFTRDREGVYTEVLHPNQPAGDCTSAERINGRGSVVGSLWTNGCGEENGSFVMSRQGNFEDVPFPPGLTGASVLGLNERGDLSGYGSGQPLVAWRL